MTTYVQLRLFLYSNVQKCESGEKMQIGFGTLVRKAVGTGGAALGAGIFALENAFKIDVIGGTGETGLAVLGFAALVGAGIIVIDAIDQLINYAS